MMHKGIALPAGVSLAGIESKQDRLMRDRYAMNNALRDGLGHAGDSVLWIPLEKAPKPRLITVAEGMGLPTATMQSKTRGRIVEAIMDEWSRRAQAVMEAAISPEGIDPRASPEAMAERRAEWERVVAILNTLCEIVMTLKEEARIRSVNHQPRTKKGRTRR